ncbi:hypothetical protein LEP1GSC037_3342 [Leptospira interrogans str. 2006001854]|uniref:Uncharacterized protein n=1 Tax=Leptospira interrogans str. 2006001854 TaxID=1001590 RepID=M6G7I1_LEPIR|nr:hypothetical protein LEP1GSC037_3342 [Leptospira interrogans str. 2006001854]
MDRRSGLKKAHFSSVPTRMSLLTCKKYVFLIEKIFPSHPKIGKTQHNAFLWVALENSAQRFPMGRVGKLSTTLSYGSRCGVGYGKGRSAEFSRIDPFRFIPNSCF